MKIHHENVNIMSISKTHKNVRGSVLVFSLLILAIMLSAALSVLAVSLAEKRSASSTRTSVQSFNVAQSGVERVFQAVYKGTTLTDLSSLSDAIGGSGCTVSGGVAGITINSIAGGSVRLTFQDSADVDIDSCSAGVSVIAVARSLGTAGSASRVIEAAIAPNLICTGSPKTLSLSMAGLGSSAHPRDIAFDTATNSIWVTAGQSGSSGVLLRIDPVNMVEIARYGVGTNPKGITYDSGTRSIWVANNTTSSSGRIDRVNVYNGSIVGPSYSITRGYPSQIAYDPDTESVWVANYDSNAKYISRISTGTGIGRDYVTDQSGNQGIAYDAHTKSVWTTNWTDGSVRSYRYNTVADTITSRASGAPCSSLSIGYASHDPNTNSMWVACYQDHWVRTVNDSTGALGSKINITPSGSNSPYGVAIDGDNKRVFVLGTGGPVAKINALNGSVIENITDTNLTGGYNIIAETYTKSAWVVNSNGNSITKICLNP